MRPKKRTLLTDPQQIPDSMTAEQEAEFWRTHEITEEFLEKKESPPAALLPPRSRPISIRFDEDTVQRLKAVAKKKNKGYQTLLKEFVIERLHEDEVAELIVERLRKELDRYSPVLERLERYALVLERLDRYGPTLEWLEHLLTPAVPTRGQVPIDDLSYPQGQLQRRAGTRDFIDDAPSKEMAKLGAASFIDRWRAEMSQVDTATLQTKKEEDKFTAALEDRLAASATR
jgi:predicted DNA binding CopG/RHH family protein